MGKNYIPSQDAGFDNWQRNLINLIIAYYVAWAIAAADEANLITLQTTWVADYATGGKLMAATRTKQQVAAKTAARKVYEKAIRVFVTRWVKGNTLISNAQRAAMGVTVSKTTRTPVQVPDTAPTLTIASGSGSQLIIGFRQAPHVITSLPTERSAVKKAKPKGYHAVRLYYVVGGTAPTSTAGCNVVIGMTKSPHKLRFNAADAGKTVYFFACWVNTKEQEGPLTPLHTAVVPS